LSSLKFTQNDETLLQKGLSFIPTPKLLPVSNILENRNKLIRNLKIKCAFKNNPRDFNHKNKTFVEKSTWIPNNALLLKNGTLASTLAIINEIENCTTEIIKDSKTCEKFGKTYIVSDERYNLSPQEFSALNRIKNNENIVIKPADKGGSLVIMDKNNYLFEAYKQLNDQKYYKKLKEPIFHRNKIDIGKVLANMHNDGFISKKQLEYLSGPDDTRPRRFYILPKIHKNINTWPIPNKMPPGRPVVSDIDSESYRVSDYVDFFLKPLACKHPSYIKNSYDFTDKIKNCDINQSTYLVTGDITSLYTNMKHDIMLSSIGKIFKTYPDPNRPENYLLKLLKLMIENNDFEFNSETYHQICGCPQGKIIGPSAANIYLIDFDKAAMSDFKIKPSVFFRFLDDIFLLWNGSLEELKQYENFLNNLIPGIEIKLEASLVSANFLDITIYKNQNLNNTFSIGTKIYVKPTDTQNLLHTKSFHPPHTTKGILKSQLIRYKRISSTWEDYIGAAKTLFTNLRDRGYSWTKMWDELKYIWFYHKDKEIKSDDEKSNPDLFPIILHYDKIGSKLSQKYRDILNKSNLFHNTKFLLAYKNHKNLSKYLINSVIKIADDTETQKYFCKKCNNKKCKACNHIIEGFTFSCYNTKKTFNLKQNITCKSKNLIYLVTCRKCLKQYVGQTSRTLAERINNHLSCIRKHKNNPISLHFNMPDHSLNDFNIQGIELINSQNNIAELLNNKETYWQHTLQTIFPLGINHLNYKYF
jgi:hypothetical protein